MALRGKVVDFEAAARLVPSGATVSVSSSSGVLLPDRMLAALARRHEESGEPRDLTVVFPIAIGDMFGQPGIDHLARPGMLRRVIGGSYPSGPSSAEPPKIVELISRDDVEAYNLPSGMLMQLHREIAGKRPGVLTRVGLGTFVDPRQRGGRMNQRTTEDLLEVVRLRGEEWLFLPSFPIDAAIVRGTTADEDGNITMEHEPVVLGAHVLALAARNSGGTVIAQVKRLVARGTLDPHRVRVPGVLVDAVVVDPEQRQATLTEYDPALSGEVRLPLDRIARPELRPDKVIARRAALELAAGQTVALGFGVSALIPRVLLEEGQHGRVTFCIEQGAVGGVPAIDFQFGCSLNPSAIVDSPFQFDFFNGGGFDVAFLSFLQYDADGNVNVSLLPSRPHVTAGIGGFMDITANARRLVFSGYYRAGGLKLATRDGRLEILEEGAHAKLVRAADQITFSGRRARERGADVMLITERGVFEQQDDGLTLVEVAPGIDPERDVVRLAELPIRISPDLKPMDGRLFRPEPIGLRLGEDGDNHSLTTT
jgi:propionate CoA-transferase